MILDAVVIGKGLMGTAVTRYLSQAGARTAVIGPDEPANWHTHPGVFASHYDQGRITHRLSRDETWSRLADQAIAQYPYLEAQSGISFHTPCGGLMVAAPRMDEGYLERAAQMGRQLHIDYAQLSAPELATRFPLFSFPGTCNGMYEPAPAGFINPRGLIQAQLAVAQQHGAHTIRETAVKVSFERQPYTVTTDTGHQYRAEKVVVAAGAFTNCHDILPQKLVLRIKTETILLAALPPPEVNRLAALPTLIYQIESEALADIYLLPPILYPDGRWYLKMGCNTAADSYPDSLAAMREWMMRGESERMRGPMEAAMRAVLPGLSADCHTGRCLVTYTPSGKPMIDEIAANFYVAVGGNGAAAKSSDAVGRLAADLVLHGRWPAAIDRSSFTASVG